jgi:kynurenine formamidase
MAESTAPEATSATRNGPALSQPEFDTLFDRLRRWAPGGVADERGTFASITPEATLAALAVPRSGRTVSLALPINRTSGPDNAKPALHHMVDLGDVEAPEPSAHKDFIGLDYHGKATTHLDAICHIGYRGELFGGVSSAAAFSSLGSGWAAVTNLAGGFVLRGVLLDVPAATGIEWLEPGTAVRADDIARTAEVLGVDVGPGDAVLLRTGHGARRAVHGPWNSDNASAGLHVDAMPLLADLGVVLLGADGDSDVRPSPVAGVHSPIHALALTALGMPLLDNLELEALSHACAEQGRYEFLLIVAPLVVPRGTGSPVNPIAVL